MQTIKTIPYWEGNELVIFDSKLEEQNRLVLSRVSRKKRAGYTLLAASLLSIAILVSPVITAEFGYRINFLTKPVSSANFETIKPETGNVIESGFGKYLWLQKAGIKAPASWDYALVVPKAGINTKVTPNVDPSNQQVYEAALLSGVAQAKSTSAPGEAGNTYIFGHSSDYPWNKNAFADVLYPLKYVGAGDQVYLVYKNKIYVYQITETKIVDSTNTSYLTDKSKDNGNTLIIQTCWPPETDWQRLLIIAKPVNL